jgi:tetratricopeptide (TPR) repeat protein
MIGNRLRMRRRAPAGPAGWGSVLTAVLALSPGLLVAADPPSRPAATQPVAAPPPAADLAEMQSVLDRANALVAQERFADALPMWSRLSALARRDLGDQSPAYALSLLTMAGLRDRAGDEAGAGPLYRQAVEVYRVAVGDRDPRYLDSLRALTGFHEQAGRYAEAEPMCRQVVEVARATLGERSADYAGDLHHLAAIYDGLGEYARSLNGLACLYEEMGEPERSAPLFRQAMEIVRSTAGTPAARSAACWGPTPPGPPTPTAGSCRRGTGRRSCCRATGGSPAGVGIVR